MQPRSSSIFQDLMERQIYKFRVLLLKIIACGQKQRKVEGGNHVDSFGRGSRTIVEMVFYMDGAASIGRP